MSLKSATLGKEASVVEAQEVDEYEEYEEVPEEQADEEAPDEQNAQESEESSELTDSAKAKLEEEARREGWDPNFKGPAHLRKTAEEFLRDGAHINKVLKDRNSRLQTESQDFKHERDELRELLKATVNFNREQKEREEDARLKALKDERDSAVYVGDVSEVDRLQDELDKARDKIKGETKALSPQQIAWTREFEGWKSEPENSWYDNDPYLTHEAEEIAKSFVDGGRFKFDKALLSAVNKKMKSKYGDEMQEYLSSKGFTEGTEEEEEEDVQPAKRKAPALNSPKRKSDASPRSDDKKSFSDVPKSHQKMFYDQQREFGRDAKGNWVYTEADFIKSYTFD